MTQELEPCPFCGVDFINGVIGRPDRLDPTWEHPESGCILQGFSFDAIPELNTLWNTRALPRQAEWLPANGMCVVHMPSSYRSYLRDVLACAEIQEDPLGFLNTLREVIRDNHDGHTPNPPEVMT